jgi:metal-responsive CopG/Arc/MetJ family transcriptional regulator
MSENKLKIMSLSLDSEMYDLVKNSSKKLGHKNVSQMIRDLISKYLDLLVNDKDEIPVILRVPSNLKENPKELEEWLSVRTQALVKALSKNEDCTH